MARIYALVVLDELAPILEDARDDDVEAEAIYIDHLNEKLAPYGLTVIELEMEGWIDGLIEDLMRRAREGGK